MTKTIKTITRKATTVACGHCTAKECKTSCIVDKMITASR